MRLQSNSQSFQAVALSGAWQITYMEIMFKQVQHTRTILFFLAFLVQLPRLSVLFSISFRSDPIVQFHYFTMNRLIVKQLQFIPTDHINHAHTLK